MTPLQFNLSLRPGKFERMGNGRGVPETIGHRDGLVPGSGHPGRKRQDRPLARFDQHGAAKGDDRIEHGPDRALEGIDESVECVRLNSIAAATDERFARGFEGRRPGDVGRQQVHGEDGFLIRRSGPPPAQDCGLLPDPLGFEEEFVEGRVSRVGGMGREDDFRITREIEHVGSRAVIRQRDAANLRILIGHDADVHPRFDVPVPASEFGFVDGISRFVFVGFPMRGVVGGRPRRAVAPIPHVEERAVAIERRVGVPARQVEFAAAAVPAAGVRDHRGEAAVRKQVRSRDGRVRRRHPPLHGIFGNVHFAGNVRGRPVGIDHGCGVGDAFVEQ